MASSLNTAAPPTEGIEADSVRYTGSTALEPPGPGLAAFSGLNARLSRWAMYLACLCLVGLLGIVVYGVVLRYVFNDAPPYVEQVALLLVISVAMFGAAAGVRDAGHIGLDSAVALLSPALQRVCGVIVCVLGAIFGIALLAGSAEMALSTQGATIPTLGISEAYRYLPVLVGGALISLFSIEHLVARVQGREVLRSWH